MAPTYAKMGQEPSTPNRGLRVRDMTKETDSGLFDDSRRSFMKKGALTAGAVALGTAGAGTAAAQDGGDGEVIVHADDYFPGAGFTVAAALNNQTRDDLLGRPVRPTSSTAPTTGTRTSSPTTSVELPRRWAS